MKEYEGITSFLFSTLFFIEQYLCIESLEMSQTGRCFKTVNFIHAISPNLCEFVALLEEVRIQKINL
jgi:hypothetical protein